MNDMRWPSRASVCLVLAILPGLSVGPAVTEKVFRWTDENGQVHYGARPGGEDAEQIQIRDRKTDRDAAQGARDREAMRRRMLDSYREERERKAAEKKKLAAAEKTRNLRCRQLQRHWKNLNHYGPLYYRNKSGGREFLDAEARQAEKDKVAEQMEKTCGGRPDD